MGSFLFTIILARLLMPEMFGYYSLALSIILIFTVISELGVNQTFIRFISKDYSKNNNKIRKYLPYFIKIKIFLIIISGILLFLLSGYLAKNIYQKPIFLSLLFGILYIFFIQLLGFCQSIFQAFNNFKFVFKGEIIFQISRIFLVPLIVIFLIQKSFSDEKILAGIIIFLAVSMFISSVFLFLKIKRTYLKNNFPKKKIFLSKKQKYIINNFLFVTATLALSGVFFGNIDRVMLGIFVEGEFIGYYTAAFSLIGALVPIIGFSSIALFPIFNRLKTKQLELVLKKSLKITFFISILGFLIALIFSNLIISIVYGKDFSPAINIFRIFSFLLFITPLIAIYQSYYISKGNLKILVIILISSTLLNIILNYFLITSLITYGPLWAVYGATIATLISQFIYFLGLRMNKKI